MKNSERCSVIAYAIAIRKDITEEDKDFILSKITDEFDYTCLAYLFDNIDKEYDLKLDNWYLKIDVDNYLKTFEELKNFEKLKSIKSDKFKIGFSNVKIFDCEEFI